MYCIKLLFVCTIFFIQISCNNDFQKRTNIVLKQKVDFNKIDTISKANAIAEIENVDFIEFTKQLQKEKSNYKQEYLVNAKTATTVVCKHGLKVNVEPCNLAFEDGSSPAGKIKLEVIEAQSPFDFIVNNAPTICNGNILSSGGSYFINLTNNGRQLHLKKDKALKIEAPKINLKDGMQLYYGNKADDNSISWQETSIIFNNILNKILYDEQMYAGYNYIDNLKEIEDKLYRSTKEMVSFNNKFMTIGNLVDFLNKDSIIMVIDTVYLKATRTAWEITVGKEAFEDTSAGYFKTYRIMNKESLNKFKQEFAKRKALKDKKQQEYEATMQRYNSTAAQEKDKADYYAPIDITRLGWINCDKPLGNETIPLEAELPITFNNSPVKHYVIMRSLNGMIQGTKTCINGRFNFENEMPVGEKATIISITKKNGEYYLAENKLLFTKNTKQINLNFNKTSVGEIKEKLFSKI
jgi:hypothetical protein